MANVSSATSFFPKAEENSVAMTLSGSILAGAATVGINGMTNYTDGDVVVFTVDPATASLKQVFTGTKSGANIINCVWTEVPTGGSNVGHAAGATVIDYVSATHWDLFQKGVTASLNQDGSMKSSAVQTALNISSGATGGWNPLGFAPTSVTYNGNHSYSLVFNAHDLTPQLTPGMRLQMQRTVTAPTQSTSLNGTTQYYSKASPTGMAQTDSITEYAHIKLTSYAQGGIISRNNGTTDGWKFYVNASGQLILAGARVGDDLVTSVQSLPLNKWVHVAANINTTTTTANIYIDGVFVPATYTNNANTGFAAPTQSLLIGATNGASPTDFFPGKIAQAASFSAVISQANLLAYSAQGLAGTETSEISAYSFNNSITDLNANANNLTANGSAVATNADTPFGQTYALTGYTNGSLCYGIVTSVSFSTNTTVVVQVPEGDTIPTSGGVSAVSYATVKTPYGMPVDIDKWRVLMINNASPSQVSPSASTWYNIGSIQLSIPIGAWRVSYNGFGVPSGAVSGAGMWATISTANNSQSDINTTTRIFNASNTTIGGVLTRQVFYNLSSQTVYYVNAQSDLAAPGTLTWNTNSPFLFSAECAYL